MSFVRDRFRTMINVLGDALAAGIMAHICRKEFIKDGDEVTAHEAGCARTDPTSSQLPTVVSLSLQKVLQAQSRVFQATVLA